MNPSKSVFISVLLALVLIGAGMSCKTAAKNSTAPTASPSPAAVASPSPSPSPKATAAVATGSRLEVRCDQGTDKRVVTVVPNEKGCELHYSKFGQSEVIANSSRGTTAYCDEVQAKVRKNLEASGFTCQ